MSNDEIASDAPSPTNLGVSNNRLSIAHLLLWVTMASVVLAIDHQTFEYLRLPTGNHPFERLLTIDTVVRLLAVPAYGAGFAGLAMALWRRVRSRPGFPTQPGHWLLVLIATQQICEWVSQQFRDYRYWQCYFWISVFYLLHAGLNAIAATRADQRYWLLIFWLRAGGFLGLSAGWQADYVLGGVREFPGISLIFFVLDWVIFASNLACLAAALLEFRRGVPRDALHYLGIIAILAITMQMTASWFIWNFGPSWFIWP